MALCYRWLDVLCWDRKVIDSSVIIPVMLIELQLKSKIGVHLFLIECSYICNCMHILHQNGIG